MASDEQSSKIYKYGFLSAIVVLGISIGLCQEIIILTLPNLHIKFDVSYEILGNVLSFRGFGNILTLFIFSFLYDFHSSLMHFLVFVECIIGGVCIIIIPWCHSFWVAAIFIYIQSSCQSGINNACQIFILRIFKKNSAGKMQMYHLGYILGRFLTGFLCRPFLIDNKSDERKMTKYCLQKLSIANINSSLPIRESLHNVTTQDSTEILQSHFEYAYILVGLLTIIIAFIFLSLKSFKSPLTLAVERLLWWKAINPKFSANGKACLGLSVTFLLFWYYALYLAGQSVVLPYLIVYAMDPCKEYHLSHRDATYLHSTITASFILAQLSTCFIIDKYPVALLITFNTLNVIFVGILSMYANKYQIVLWICLSGMRFCNSVVYPIGTSYLNRFIVVTSRLITLSFVGATFGVVIGQSIGGRILDNYPSYVMMYASLGFMTALLLVSTIFVLLTTKVFKSRFSSADI